MSCPVLVCISSSLFVFPCVAVLLAPPPPTPAICERPTPIRWVPWSPSLFFHHDVSFPPPPLYPNHHQLLVDGMGSRRAQGDAQGKWKGEAGFLPSFPSPLLVTARYQGETPPASMQGRVGEGADGPRRPLRGSFPSSVPRPPYGPIGPNNHVRPCRGHLPPFSPAGHPTHHRRPPATPVSRLPRGAVPLYWICLCRRYPPSPPPHHPQLPPASPCAWGGGGGVGVLYGTCCPPLPPPPPNDNPRPQPSSPPPHTTHYGAGVESTLNAAAAFASWTRVQWRVTRRGGRGGGCGGR